MEFWFFLIVWPTPHDWCRHHCCQRWKIFCYCYSAWWQNVWCYSLLVLSWKRNTVLCNFSLLQWIIIWKFEIFWTEGYVMQRTHNNDLLEKTINYHYLVQCSEPREMYFSKVAPSPHLLSSSSKCPLWKAQLPQHPPSTTKETVVKEKLNIWTVHLYPCSLCENVLRKWIK